MADDRELKKASKSNKGLVKLLFDTAMDMEYPAALAKRKSTETAALMVKQLNDSDACADLGVHTPTADTIMEWLKFFSAEREKKRSKTRVRARDRTPITSLHAPSAACCIAHVDRCARTRRAHTLARARSADGRGRRSVGRRG